MTHAGSENSGPSRWLVALWFRFKAIQKGLPCYETDSYPFVCGSEAFGLLVDVVGQEAKPVGPCLGLVCLAFNLAGIDPQVQLHRGGKKKHRAAPKMLPVRRPRFSATAQILRVSPWNFRPTLKSKNRRGSVVGLGFFTGGVIWMLTHGQIHKTEPTRRVRQSQARVEVRAIAPKQSKVFSVQPQLERAPARQKRGSNV